MKFVTKCGYFHRALSVVSGLNDTTDKKDYIKHALIRVKDNKVELTSLAGGATMQHTFEPDPDALISDQIDGACVVDLGRMSSLLSTYESADSLMIEALDNNKASVRISTDGNFMFHTKPVDVFPSPEPIDEIALYKSQNKDLKRGIGLIKRCMADRDTRAYLNGMLFDFDIDSLTAVATDGHCLGLTEIRDTAPEGNKCGVRSIVGRKHVELLIRKLKYFGDDMLIKADGNRVQFSDVNTVLTFSTVDATFPEYRKAIPKQSKNRVEMDVLRTEALFERVKVMSNKGVNGVEVQLAREMMTVCSHNSDDEAGSDTLEIEYEGEEQSFGVNANFMINQLTSIKDAGIREIEFRKGANFKDPIVIEPSDKKADNFLFVIGSMRI